MHMHLRMLTHVHTRTHTLIIHAPHMPVLTYAQTHAHTLAYTHTRTQTHMTLITIKTVLIVGDPSLYIDWFL